MENQISREKDRKRKQERKLSFSQLVHFCFFVVHRVQFPFFFYFISVMKKVICIKNSISITNGMKFCNFYWTKNKSRLLNIQQLSERNNSKRTLRHKSHDECGCSRLNRRMYNLLQEFMYNLLQEFIKLILLESQAT